MQDPSPRPLAGRVALVTGATRRIAIGAAVARRLASAGAAIVLHDWAPHDLESAYPRSDPGGADALAEELRARGTDVLRLSSDLADPAAPAALVDAADERFGRLDVVVAAHARSGSQALEALTADELDRTFAVNTRATLLLVQAFAARHDDAAPGGRVVLFTSGQYHGAMPGELPYIASKAALHELTPSLAVHLMPRGITVNCIDPGPNDTGWPDEATRAMVLGRMPAGRWGAPGDAASLVAWLVSDDAGWVTGQTIASDGGWSAVG